MSESDTSSSTFFIKNEKTNEDDDYEEGDFNFDDSLEGKASSSYLSARNVKSLIKEVVTNEFVIAMLKNAENPDRSDVPPFEPRLTRAKTRELLVDGSLSPSVEAPASPGSPLGLDLLFNEDLLDESDEEYVPPNLALSQVDCDTNDTDVNAMQKSAAPQIAARTRSKLSLHTTPLESIESTFQPPDITTDMYDINCDDDVWTEFLQTFQLPLEAVVDNNDDDEVADPEYNILTDEEHVKTVKPEKEELRDDKGVNITKKELNTLIHEIFSSDEEEIRGKEEVNQQQDPVDDIEYVEVELEPAPTLSIGQLQLLVQQMTQFVQLSTQSFLLLHKHFLVEYANEAPKFKAYLEDLQTLAMLTKDSIVKRVINLQWALDLIANWERDHPDQDPFVEQEVFQTRISKELRRQYSPKIPRKVMAAIVNSCVFLYTHLLPWIAFKPRNVLGLGCKNKPITSAETSLIANALEEIAPNVGKTKTRKFNSFKAIAHEIANKYLWWHGREKLRYHILRKSQSNAEENPIRYYYQYGKVPPTYHLVVPFDQMQILPPKLRPFDQLPQQIYDYVSELDQLPQQIYDYVIPLVKVPTLSIPVIYEDPTGNRLILPSTLKSSSNKVVHTNSVQVNNQKIREKNVCLKKATMNEAPNDPHKSRNDGTESQNTIVNHSHKNMPFLAVEIPHKSTNQKPSSQPLLQPKTANNFENLDEKIMSSAITESVKVPVKTTDIIHSTPTTHSEKDDMDEINELMKASSTVRSVHPTGAERKRVKIVRNFIDNLVVGTPSTLQEQQRKDHGTLSRQAVSQEISTISPSNSSVVNELKRLLRFVEFAAAYLKKLRTTLERDDYRRLVETLVSYDETTGDFRTLYAQVTAILTGDDRYREINDEFLLFLTEVQAFSVNRLQPYRSMRSLAQLMRKIHLFFRNRPFKMKKFLRSLTALTKQSSPPSTTTTLELVRATLLPHLDGCTVLAEWLLDMFNDGKPSNILLKDSPYEHVDLVRELAKPTDDILYEMLRVPDNDGRYGGFACVCSCHRGTDIHPQLRNKLMHCKRCGLKFIQGKPYILTRHGLRAASITFPGNPYVDHKKRLMAANRKTDNCCPTKAIVSVNNSAATVAVPAVSTSTASTAMDSLMKSNIDFSI